MAPEVGFGALFPCIFPESNRLHVSNQANSATTRAYSFTAICWQFCWQLQSDRDVGSSRLGSEEFHPSVTGMNHSRFWPQTSKLPATQKL